MSDPWRHGISSVLVCRHHVGDSSQVSPPCRRHLRGCRHHVGDTNCSLNAQISFELQGMRISCRACTALCIHVFMSPRLYASMSVSQTLPHTSTTPPRHLHDIPTTFSRHPPDPPDTSTTPNSMPSRVTHVPRHLHDTSQTPPRHLPDPPRHLHDTPQTPPRHLHDTSQTSPDPPIGSEGSEIC